ncbi:autophagy-related protein 3-like [Hibiscus syriacus]|uniref:Autophagy-related protein 3-like n=1 Tax=Hibiscus syriacus TaxID=106335 RepID=A0A6A3C0H3_HIBSY|nr:autophagy-related protein 3-like [Hibiscus syriacus]
MDDRGGSFVAVRRISQGIERGNTCHSTSAEAVAGSTAWLGRGLSCACAQSKESDARPPFDLTPAQMSYTYSVDIIFVALHTDHFSCNMITHIADQSLDSCGSFKGIMECSFPDEELRGLVSEQWKEMGWQGKDPSTVFRGGGFISLENLLFFARNFPVLLNISIQKSFKDLLWKQEGDRSVWEYPFAVAGVNITFMLIQMLDLEAVKPRTIVGAVFLKFLSESESAFDLLYCITFKLMDHQWLAMIASYMDFNTVMKATRRQLERELLLEDITRLEDLPSYSLLTR